MKKVLKKRTGFTLVELLIVIIIIGILAGAMLLVAGSGTDKAEATKIVSNLRSLKAAALMYYADNPNATVAAAAGTQIDLLKKYMDRDLDEVKNGEYVFLSGTVGSADVWFVGLTGVKPSGAKAKLDTATAKDAGLFGATALSDPYVDGDYFDAASDPDVYMRAR